MQDTVRLRLCIRGSGIRPPGVYIHHCTHVICEPAPSVVCLIASLTECRIYARHSHSLILTFCPSPGFACPSATLPNTTYDIDSPYARAMSIPLTLDSLVLLIYLPLLAFLLFLGAHLSFL
ncbi:hypothetical protein PLICRDRAFT_568753 [Plicaturopsis crispa FD-325 SS-3]|nr:hypothetical protein PLICRDRAFT_568753 [Plicaturopsis crispa FD-325 SS-3]